MDVSVAAAACLLKSIGACNVIMLHGYCSTIPWFMCCLPSLLPRIDNVVVVVVVGDVAFVDPVYTFHKSMRVHFVHTFNRLISK